MPYLRFNRDKRGYENTFVVHSSRRRGKGRSRILYWFRTPPGVRVGRAALDEEAIRLIEEHNPRVQFDWTQILKGQPEPGEPEDSRPRHTPPRPQRASTERRSSRTEVALPRTIAPGGDGDRLPAIAPPDESSLEPADELAIDPDAAGLDEPASDTEAPGERPPTAAHARLGSEGVLRLRGRYADILAGINDRVPESPRREELKAQAERLNPDNWVTEEEVRLGLEQYETVFESLRAVAGRRRRRRRGRPGNPL